MDLEEVKEYLRIDFEEDDEYIQFLIDVSESLLFSLTNKLDQDSSLYAELTEAGQQIEAYTAQQVNLSKVYRYAVISEMYENRGLTAEGANDKVRLIYSSILTSLIYS